jgi:hypothetical protein
VTTRLDRLDGRVLSAHTPPRPTSRSTLLCTSGRRRRSWAAAGRRPGVSRGLLRCDLRGADRRGRRGDGPPDVARCVRNTLGHRGPSARPRLRANSWRRGRADDWPARLGPRRVDDRPRATAATDASALRPSGGSDHQGWSRPVRSVHPVGRRTPRAAGQARRRTRRPEAAATTGRQREGRGSLPTAVDR